MYVYKLFKKWLQVNSRQGKVLTENYSSGGVTIVLYLPIWALIMNGTETNEFIDKVIINAVLAFTAYGLDTGSDANVPKNTYLRRS